MSNGKIGAMLRLLACALLFPTLALADDERPFDESQLCTEQRAEATRAADQLRDRPNSPSYAAKRDQTAKTLAECIDRERRVYDARIEEKRKEADAKTKEQDRLRALMSSKPTLHLALSARLCLESADRAGALREIAAEKKYARVGGVQNMSKLYELQQDVRRFDESKVQWQKALKNLKLKALVCSSSKVKPVVDCLRSPIRDNAACTADGAAVEAAIFLEDNGIGPLARPDGLKNVTPGP